MHGEGHVLQSDLMYVPCHGASARRFDLTIGLAIVRSAICMKSLDLMRVCFQSRSANERSR